MLRSCKFHFYTPLTLLLAAAILASVNSYAQTRVTLTLGDADIMDLVNWAQDVTNKTIIVHPAVKGRVTVVAGDPMTKGEAYQVFLSVLEVNGFSVIESDKSIKIIPTNLAKQSSAPVVDEQGDFLPEDIVVRIIKIQNVAATQLLTILRPLVPQEGHLVAYPPTNSIIVADRASNIAEILKLIRKIDQVGVVDIDLLPIQFASAKEIVNVISSLIPMSQESQSQTFKIAVDERSNSILITGDPATRQQIKSLIQRLDKPLSGEGNTQVIYLNYANAMDLVPILQSVSGSEQKNEKDQGLTEVEVNIQANEALNALVITAPPSLIQTMKGVIHKLDVRRPQVIVEALIVEVSEDLTTSFGVAWQVPPHDDNQVIGGFSSFPSEVSPVRLNEAGDLTLGSGISLGYLRGATDIRAVIAALKGTSNANILSTPTIMALDNEEAHILVGENVPFVTGAQSRPGNIDPFQTIERQDIGVSLTVKPRINNDNSVTLDIEQTVESIGRTDVETADIITNKREIRTRVLIENGEVLVLGGLIRDEAIESESRVPLLGSIPLIGRAFRSTTSNSIKRNLMVFIHPQILRDPQSGVEETRRRYDYMKEKQEGFRERVDSFFLPKELPKLNEPAESE